MRVLYITNGYFGSNEANMVQSHNSVAALCHMDAVRQVTFIGYTRGAMPRGEIVAEYTQLSGAAPSFKLDFQPLPVLQTSWLRTLLRLRSLLASLDYRQYDVIYTRSRDALILLYGLGLKRFKYEAHSLDDSGAHYKRLLYRLSIKRGAMQIVSITQTLQDDFAAHYHVPQSRLRLIRCAARIPPQSANRADRNYVGFCGSDYPGKGLAEFIQLARDNPAQQFLAVVRTSEHSAKLLTELPANLTVQKNAPNAAVYAALAQCRIALAPYSATATTSGGWSNARYISPLKVFEYMALGCLVITSSLPAIEEVIQHGHNGLLYAADDYAALASAFEQALAAFENGAAMEMIARAEADFAAKYSYDARAQMMLEPLECGVMDEAPSSSPA